MLGAVVGMLLLAGAGVDEVCVACAGSPEFGAAGVCSACAFCVATHTKVPKKKAVLYKICFIRFIQVLTQAIAKVYFGHTTDDLLQRTKSLMQKATKKGALHHAGHMSDNCPVMVRFAPSNKGKPFVEGMRVL